MSSSIRIALAQLDPVVGHFELNTRKIKEAYERACQERARLLLTPEMSLCGYPPHDLVDRPEMFIRNEKALDELVKLTKGRECALAIGHISRNPSTTGRPAQNSITVLADGQRVFTQAKTLLPTYDVFDEARYFEPAHETKLWEWDGHRIAFAICEDLWGGDPHYGRRLYGRDPVDDYAEQGPDLLISLSASPFHLGKSARRHALHGEVAKRVKAPLLYVNQMGATDEILFDGGSFAMNAAGEIQGRLPFFRNAFACVDWDQKSGLTWKSDEDFAGQMPVEMELLSDALLTGIGEYFEKTGFKQAIIGLSGGIDSAVVATLATRALGASNVLGVAMPSQFSSSHSLADAEKLAANLGIRFEVRPIKFSFATLSRELSEGRGQLAPIALENLQARLRGLTLMTLANHYNALVLNTSNKSELAVGYCTQYGDMVGALAPIADVYKTQVYALAQHANQAWGAPIPENSISKAPSAELAPNQKDEDSLPPYSALDPLLKEYIEDGVTVEELEKRHSGTETGQNSWVREILRKIEISEYKRRQAAPVLRVSGKAFGIGRRIPIAKKWDQ